MPAICRHRAVRCGPRGGRGVAGVQSTVSWKLLDAAVGVRPVPADYARVGAVHFDNLKDAAAGDDVDLPVLPACLPVEWILVSGAEYAGRHPLADLSESSPLLPRSGARSLSQGRGDSGAMAA